jgi:protein TonB
LALFATVGLALLMYELIRTEEVPVSDADPHTYVDFWPLLEDEPLPGREPRAEPPPKPVEQPRAPRPVTQDPGPGVHIGGPVTGPGNPPKPIPGSGYADGDLMPIVAITPDYPERAKKMGAQGYVTLEFTVDRRGQVRDARVLEAQPRGIFERSALRAIERFRYRPRVVDGKALAVTGVRTRLRFSLDR